MCKRIRGFTNWQVGGYHRLSFCAGLFLNLIEEGWHFSAVALKTVSCPRCDRMIVLSDNVHAGEIIRCCGKEFRLTHEFGSFALE